MSVAAEVTRLCSPNSNQPQWEPRYLGCYVSKNLSVPLYGACTIKNCCGLAGSIVALKLKLPVGPKMPVPMLVQLLRGAALRSKPVLSLQEVCLIRH
jgi:hypothetical protein